MFLIRIVFGQLKNSLTLFMGIFFQKRRNILSKDTDNGCLNVVVKCIGKNPQTDAEGYYKVVHHHEGIISKELFDEEQQGV